MRADLRRRMFRRSLLLQSVWNVERMQNVGFLFALSPALEAAWRSSEDRLAARRRHLEFFNSHPCLASYALGFAARAEKEAARLGPEARAEAFRRMSSVKRTLGSALAALGDPLFWGALRPFCLALALAVMAAFEAAAWGEPVASRPAGFTVAQALFGTAAYLVPYNALSFWTRWAGIAEGWSAGYDLPSRLARAPWRRVERALRLAGLLVAAGAALMAGAAHARSVSGTLAGAAALAALVGLKRAGVSNGALLAAAFVAAAAAAAVAGPEAGG